MTMKAPTRSLLLLVFALAASPAHAIDDGFEAEACAWPEVVRVFSGWGIHGDLDGPEKATCTGVYIGGITVLTAAECVNFQPTPYEIHFADQFGFDPRDLPRLRMAIPVADCRVHPVLPIAACSLIEEPTMQTIPILAPCEVGEVLVEGAELFVVGATAEKRWVSAALAGDISPLAIEFELLDTLWTTQTELSSQVLEDRDLGAPLYVRAPDGSLRIAGITIDTEPGKWIGAWMLADWLLDHEPQDVVLPCHSLVGEWAPGPACAELITDRSIGEGAWGRGPANCRTTQTIVPASTCE